MDRALRLAGAGMGAVLTGACAATAGPAPVRDVGARADASGGSANSARSAQSTIAAGTNPAGTVPAAPEVQNGTGGASSANGADAEPVPPPDLFDANLLAPDFWTRPREIRWVRPQTGETLNLVYWKDGVVSPGSYEQVCHILRDVEARKTVPIDPKLIETLWAAQAFCARYGMHHPLQILSGYRTRATNNRLVEQGLSAAHKSLHLDGRAADVRIVDLNTDVLGALVQSFARGGVGFYPRAGETGGWIHTDTGLNRSWQG